MALYMMPLSTTPQRPPSLRHKHTLLFWRKIYSRVFVKQSKIQKGDFTSAWQHPAPWLPTVWCKLCSRGRQITLQNLERNWNLRITSQNSIKWIEAHSIPINHLKNSDLVAHLEEYTTVSLGLPPANFVLGKVR